MGWSILPILAYNPTTTVLVRSSPNRMTYACHCCLSHMSCFVCRERTQISCKTIVVQSRLDHREKRHPPTQPMITCASIPYVIAFQRICNLLIVHYHRTTIAMCPCMLCIVSHGPWKPWSCVLHSFCPSLMNASAKTSANHADTLT